MRFSGFPAAIVILAAAHAGAQSGPSGTPRSDRALGDDARAPEQAAAHEHFERALTWYRAGKYRRALEELDAALARDPGGKDLVFNLALVQEKLGDLAGAVHSLQRFQGMEKDPKELERATQTIERLQGARAELLAAFPQTAASLQAATSPCPCPGARVRGRWDAWVIGSGSLAIASLLAGTVLGVRTLTLDQPGEGARARSSAVLADFAFATSLLAGAGTLVLYFGRYADPSPARAALPLPLPRISAARLEFRF